jgi:2-C-methyl-D-erythritol 4-phosphate cytidylyltransferase
MEKYAVIVAGGAGVRMGTDIPKQFLLLQNKTILWHSINAFLQAFNSINIIVVLPKEHIEKGEEIKNSFNQFSNSIQLTIGGATRFHSVQNGLKLVQKESVVFVHDAVRCLLTKQLIERCFQQTLLQGSAIPCITATDSIRITNNNIHKVVDRNSIKLIQTPQTFLSSIILPAFQQDYNETFTDEATVVEAFGKQVFLIEGETNNLKITKPIDLIVAENLLL